ncbi:MAG TPA: hypothetical protein VE623_18590 [Acidimicrobiales bacterium]|jgi:hypothetical protein|nr:hypothetical protein [Acidimicrobiales bacterium]
MTPDELDGVARLVGVYRSTVDALAHPVDDFEGLRRRWDELALIAAEIDGMLPPLSTSG